MGKACGEPILAALKQNPGPRDPLCALGIDPALLDRAVLNDKIGDFSKGSYGNPIAPRR
jgi:hypothetical protein